MTGRPARFQNRAEQLGRWYDVYAFRFGAPEKRHVAVLFNDITGRKQADERLRQMQKMESIGVLAGGVAHDFNNLLTVIMGSASCALTECPACGHSQAILAASDRAAYLTKQLLAYAGKGQFVTKTFVLTDLVEKSTPILAASVPKRVSLKFNLSQNLPPIEADPSRVEQILMNLVINAGEAIQPKTDGWIEIATGSCRITTEIASRHAPAFDVETGEHVFLEVSDSGAGMDEATMSRIFDPFFSTKFTGRGLGLAAVHGIVRSSKGFIEVRSLPGTGSTFRVCLPACQKNCSTGRVTPSAIGRPAPRVDGFIDRSRRRRRRDGAPVGLQDAEAPWVRHSRSDGRKGCTPGACRCGPSARPSARGSRNAGHGRRRAPPDSRTEVPWIENRGAQRLPRGRRAKEFHGQLGGELPAEAIHGCWPARESTGKHWRHWSRARHPGPQRRVAQVRSRVDGRVTPTYLRQPAGAAAVSPEIRSLLPQRHDRFDLHCASRGEAAGRDGDRDQQ